LAWLQAEMAATRSQCLTFGLSLINLLQKVELLSICVTFSAWHGNNRKNNCVSGTIVSEERQENKQVMLLVRQNDLAH
jgi:hypothetical protein